MVADNGKPLGGRHWGWRVILYGGLVAALLAIPFAFAQIPDNASATLELATLPSPGVGLSAVWTGNLSYVFGGGLLGREIHSFDPVTQTTGLVATTTTNISHASAVWTGSAAYVFGGHRSDSILRFEPGSTPTVVATLPIRLWGTSAVWDGTYAYIFGGYGGPPYCGCTLNQILRFDPTTNDVTLFPNILPMGTLWGTAVWTGSIAYIAAGYTDLATGNAFGPSDVLMSFEPSTGTATLLEAKLPLARITSSSVWDGSRMLVFGGNTWQSIFMYSFFPIPIFQGGTEIAWFDPLTQKTGLASATLPRDSWWAAAFYDGCAAYIIGGHSDTASASQSAPTDRIMRYGPEPCLARAAFIYEIVAMDCLGTRVRFEDASLPVGSSVAWEWDFGDGQRGYSNPVEHGYRNPGTYVVNLTATDAHGTSMTATRTVAVAGAALCRPTMDPMDAVVMYAGDLVVACATAHPGMGGVLQYRASGLPEGAELSPDGRCVTWSPVAAQRGFYVCILFSAQESPSGLSAATCLTILVKTPRDAVSPRDLVADTDQDGVADIADNCPDIPNHDQADWNHNGIGDACEPTECVVDFPSCKSMLDLRQLHASSPGSDIDQDGIVDIEDNCPDVANHSQSDFDGDYIGDACDLDIDGDGIVNHMDACPYLANPGGGRPCEVIPVMAGRKPLPLQPLAGNAAGGQHPAGMVWGAMAFLASILLLAAVGRTFL